MDYREDSDDDQVAQPNSEDDGEWGKPVIKSRPKRSRAPRQQKPFRFLDLVRLAGVLGPKLDPFMSNVPASKMMDLKILTHT